MNPAVIAVGYISWHYGQAFRDIFSVWTNITWFVVHFFSMPMLLRTLFAPWKRMKEGYHLKTGLEDFFESVVVNTMSRIVGAVVRLVIILVGLAALVVMLLGVIVAYLFWITTPLVLVLSLITGIGYLF